MDFVCACFGGGCLQQTTVRSDLDPEDFNLAILHLLARQAHKQTRVRVHISDEDNRARRGGGGLFLLSSRTVR